jgi:hypothetical protein
MFKTVTHGAENGKREIKPTILLADESPSHHFMRL